MNICTCQQVAGQCEKGRWHAGGQVTRDDMVYGLQSKRWVLVATVLFSSEANLTFRPRSSAAGWEFGDGQECGLSTRGGSLASLGLSSRDSELRLKSGL